MGITPDILSRTVQKFPKTEQGAQLGSWFLSLATIADTFTLWGKSVARRDAELRAFWPTEPIIAGAIATVCASRASVTVEFDGPPQTVKATQEVWNNCEFGKGPQVLLYKTSIDIETQDNGGFVQKVRSDLITAEQALARIEANKPLPPVMSLEHMDAGRCIRTGNPLYPVRYVDREGVPHKMAWHHIITLEEMPSPIETMNGVQYCALTRVLRAAQLMRDINVMDAEKAGGRFTKKVHLVGGVQTTTIEDKLKQAQEQADNRGLSRYIEHLLIGSLDPTATVSVASIDLAANPDDWDRAEAFKQYIAILALGFLEDYQTFAPLPGGNLGTSQQSEILHLKRQGKGPGIWARQLIHAIMYDGIIPRSVEAAIADRDIRQEQDEANVEKSHADRLVSLVGANIITPQIARQMMQDKGELSPEYLEMLNEQDATQDVTVTDEERVETPAEVQAGVTPKSQIPNPNEQQQQPAQLQAVRKALRGMREGLKALRETPVTKESPQPTNISVTMPPITLPAINVYTPETKQAFNMQPQSIQVNMPTPVVRVSNQVQPTPVNVQVDAPNVNVTNDVRPTPVTVANTVNMPKPVEEITTIERDAMSLFKRAIKRFKWE